MLYLTTSTTLLRVITSAAVALDVYASWIDADSATTPPTMTPGSQLAKITTATTTTIVPASGSTTRARSVQGVSIENIGAAANTVTVQIFDGTTAYQQESVTLAAGE